MTDRMTSARPVRLAGLLIGTLALGLVALPMAPALADDISLTETGSTMLYPLFQTWIANYTKTHPGVQITTGATGSGAGMAQAIAGKVQIGASDAYMSDAESRQHPGIINIPLAISAQTVNYNLPGLEGANVKLDGPTLAGIYTGAITLWDAPQIASLNPGVALPHQAIIPIHRADASGDTFIFSQFLSFSTPTWENTLDYGVSLNWPAVKGALTATGNDGMVKLLQSTPYAIGYVGISFTEDVAAAKLGTAALGTNDGPFVLPTQENIEAGAASLGPRTPPDERLSLVYAPGPKSYPLVNYEYAVVSTHQADPATAAALRRFLLWTILPSEENQGYVAAVHFLPLPPHTWELSQAQIQTIQ